MKTITSMNQVMNKFSFWTVALAGIVLFTSCGGDDENGGNVATITENITQNTTWKTGNVYVLGGRITVVEGVTLTIEPGVIVKGEAGSGTNATALIIARGAKIMAEGTAAQPIIFTSIADEIEPGMIASPNLIPSNNGYWGGLLILGKAPISAPGDVAQFQIEGIPPADTNGLYGGNDAADDSGVLRYVSIRHGGANIGEGNEINGLTLGGVGSGTTIEYIEVIGNQDDGIEWFGGSVSVSNALVWNAGDDGMDTDQGWSGTLDNFVVMAGEFTDHTLEIDGPEGTVNLNGHTLTNGTVRGYIGASGAGAEMADLRSNAQVTVSNVYFYNFADPTLAAGRGDYSISSCNTCSHASLQVTLAGTATLAQTMKNGVDANSTSVTLGANTVGADLSDFANWSWAAINGELD